MPKSPRKLSGNIAVKPKMSPEEACLQARATGKGPVFNDDQEAKLTALCNRRKVDPVEFLTIYTLYVISCFRPEATGPELVACVEEAVAKCPEPAEVISRHHKKSGRQPSGEDPLVKLERLYNALRTERLKSKDAELYDEKAIQQNETLLNMSWRL